MSNLSQFLGGAGGGSVIKSIQRGESLIFTGGQTSLNVTIAAVDVNKTMVNIVGGSANELGNLPRAKLLNSTTLQIVRQTNSGTCAATWEVIEFT